MNYCIKCGSKIDPDHMEFCGNCGAPIEGHKLSGAPIKQDSKHDKDKKKGVKEWLSHPLVLIAAGAIISSILIPELTSSWQVNEKELDLKFELADQIINPLHNFLFALSVFEGVYYDQSGIFNDSYKTIVFNDVDRAKVRWTSTCEEMEITLKIYYPQNSDIPTQLDRFCNAISDFYLLTTTNKTNADISSLHSRKHTAVSLLENLMLAQDSINLDELVNGSLYSSAGDQIREAILIENQKLIERIIDSDIIGYRKGMFQ